MNTGKLITVGLVGAGAWWLWRRSQTPSAAAAAGEVVPPAVTVVPPPQEPPAVTPPLTPPGMLSAGYARAMASGPIPPGGFNMDQWNWFLDDRGTLSISSSAGLDPSTIFPGDPARGGLLSWDRYAAIAREHGLAALRRRIPRRVWNYVPVRRRVMV